VVFDHCGGVAPHTVGVRCLARPKKLRRARPAKARPQGHAAAALRASGGKKPLDTRIGEPVELRIQVIRICPKNRWMVTSLGRPTVRSQMRRWLSMWRKNASEKPSGTSALPRRCPRAGRCGAKRAGMPCSFEQPSVMDDATQRRRLRNEVKQSRRLQVILAHAALVPAFLDVWIRFEHSADQRRVRHPAKPVEESETPVAAEPELKARLGLDPLQSNAAEAHGQVPAFLGQGLPRVRAGVTPECSLEVWLLCPGFGWRLVALPACRTCGRASSCS
jgi:hypothetical protein